MIKKIHESWGWYFGLPDQLCFISSLNEYVFIEAGKFVGSANNWMFFKNNLDIYGKIKEIFELILISPQRFALFRSFEMLEKISMSHRRIIENERPGFTGPWLIAPGKTFEVEGLEPLTFHNTRRYWGLDRVSEADDWKAKGLCPVCGEEGEYVNLATKCSKHGVY